MLPADSNCAIRLTKRISPRGVFSEKTWRVTFQPKIDNCFSKPLRSASNPFAHLVAGREIDKSVPFFRSGDVSEPIVHPGSSGCVPLIQVRLLVFDAEIFFQPDERGRFEQRSLESFSPLALADPPPTCPPPSGREGPDSCGAAALLRGHLPY